MPIIPKAAIEDWLTMAPPPRARMCGTTALMQRNGPFTFTAIVRSQRSGSMSLNIPPVRVANIAALLMRMSMPPNSSAAVAAIDSVDAGVGDVDPLEHRAAAVGLDGLRRLLTFFNE